MRQVSPTTLWCGFRTFYKNAAAVADLQSLIAG